MYAYKLSIKTGVFHVILVLGLELIVDIQLAPAQAPSNNVQSEILIDDSWFFLFVFTSNGSELFEILEIVGVPVSNLTSFYY